MYKTILFSALVLAASILFQPRAAVAQYGDVIPDGVYIYNGSAQTIPFDLKDRLDGLWYRFQLLPNSSEIYKNAVEIRIRTENKEPVIRPLINTARYRFVWDGSRGVWDIYKIPPRNQRLRYSYRR